MKKDILSMGYREISENNWVKPVGYNLYVISFKNNRYKFTNCFIGIDGDMHIYMSQKL